MSEKMFNHYVTEPSQTHNANLCTVYGHIAHVTNGEFKKAGVTFHLLDGGQVTLSQQDIAQAFIVITSCEFEELCEAINSRENADNKAHELYNDAFMQDSSAQDCLYEIAKAFERLGRAKESVATIRDDIIARVGWPNWINACRLYETLYDVPRDYLG